MVQDDFITLTCPNCGGKRSVKPGSTRVVCDYCGSEYLVNQKMQRDIHEGYSGCPICHSNDRSEKVSSILANQTQYIQGTTLQSHAVVNADGKVRTQFVKTPYSAVQATSLAERLNRPPVQPNLASVSKPPKPFSIEDYKISARNKKIVAYVIAAVFAWIGICPAATSLVNNSTISGSDIARMLVCPVTGLILASIFWLIGNHQLRQIERPGMIAQFEGDARAKQAAYEQAVVLRNKQIQGYRRALQNWNNLYYCNRDDCVFVPGTGKSAALAELDRYLYEV